MIFRPVSPASPTGPPMTNRPVGLTKRSLYNLVGVVEVGGKFGGNDVMPEVLADLLGGCVLGMLGRDQHLFDTLRLPVRISDRHLGLAIWPQVGHETILTNGGQTTSESVR
jgi:hypothetical protein